jgi:hypothetical protein
MKPLLCTGAFFYVPYSFLLISDKFFNGVVVWALKISSDPQKVTPGLLYIKPPIHLVALPEIFSAALSLLNLLEVV